MLKFHVSMAVLLFSTFSLLCLRAGSRARKGQLRTKFRPIQRQSVAPDVPEKITLESSVGNVVLPHDVHVKDVKLKCNVCHHQIRATELDTPHPDYLTSSAGQIAKLAIAQILRTGKSTTSAPSVIIRSRNDIADETLSSKVVIHKSCWKCHEAGTGCSRQAVGAVTVMRR